MRKLFCALFACAFIASAAGNVSASKSEGLSGKGFSTQMLLLTRQDSAHKQLSELEQAYGSRAKVAKQFFKIMGLDPSKTEGVGILVYNDRFNVQAQVYGRWNSDDVYALKVAVEKAGGELVLSQNFKKNKRFAIGLDIARFKQLFEGAAQNFFDGLEILQFQLKLRAMSR